ncbi:6,7-dimethyl-8-ribityllumazine synthase, partial [Devosia sp.]|uniref:6,7-dimethyl-8-ribityllumazine synthase n=1 Tax=Devosia sp. TaxID=1871048 RepID=UPI0025B80F00
MLIEARFYPDIADELVRGAVAILDREGVTYERVAVPGAFEIPAVIRYAIRSRDFFAARRRFDGYVALGCVIRGETAHYEYVCRESARALQNLVMEFTLAVGYGILTVENDDQAWERAAVDRGNKGGQAAETCLAMIDLKQQFNLFPR